jgi:hypothetical protein
MFRVCSIEVSRSHAMPRIMTLRNGFILVGVLVLCLISGVVGGALTRFFSPSHISISYVDFISISLSAVSVMMTVLAIFLAVFGVIGWNAISSGVHRRTEDFLNEGFKEGNVLYEMIRARTNEIMYEGISTVESSPQADDTADEPLGDPA